MYFLYAAVFMLWLRSFVPIKGNLDLSAQSPDLTPLNSFEMNGNADYMPGLIAQHHRATLTNALVAELEKIPGARFQNLGESLLRRVEAAIAAD